MEINKYIDDIIKNLTETEKDKIKPMLISNELVMDEDFERFVKHGDYIKAPDVYAFSIKSLAYIIRTKMDMENGLLDKNPNLFIEKSSDQKLRKFKKYLKDTKDLSWEDRYLVLRNIFLKGILTTYLINLQCKSIVLERLHKMANTKEKIEGFDYGQITKGLTDVYEDLMQELFRKGKLVDIIYNIHRIGSIVDGLEYLKQKNYDNIDIAIDELILMIDFFISPSPYHQEEMKIKFEFFKSKLDEKKITFEQINILVNDLLAFIILTNLLSNEELDNLFTINK
jgi:hypothetical protein